MNGYNIVTEFLGRSRKKEKLSRWNKLSSQEQIRFWNMSSIYQQRHMIYIQKYKELKTTGDKLTPSEVKYWVGQHRDGMVYAKDKIRSIQSGKEVSPSPMFR